MPPPRRPFTVQDAIDHLRQEIADRQAALRVLYDLLARDNLARGIAPDPPTPSLDTVDDGAPAGDDTNVVELPKRDAG